MSATETQKDERAKEQAKSALESIVDRVKRLEHARECDGTDCDLSDAEIYSGINLYHEPGKSPAATDDEREQYHDEEAARQSICEDPLSVEIRSGWYTPGSEPEAEEFTVLLGTGGPALRIIGELDRAEPHSARLEYQDWFTPWEEYFIEDYEQREALLTYCREFYYGD